MLVLLVLTILVFGRGLRGLAVDVSVADAAVVGWLAALSSWWVLNAVSYGLIVALLVLRRFRHGCGTPGWPTVTSSRPTCWSATGACC